MTSKLALASIPISIKLLKLVKLKQVNKKKNAITSKKKKLNPKKKKEQVYDRRSIFGRQQNK